MVGRKTIPAVSRAVFLIVPVAVLLFGCSKKPTDVEGDASRNPVEDVSRDQEAVTEEPAYRDDEWEDPVSDLIDTGDECRVHVYKLKPGAAETLEFEKLLRNKPASMSPSLETTREVLSDLGIEISIIGTDIETYVTTYPVWAVDLGDSEPYRAALERGGQLASLGTEGRGLKGITGVKHVRDNYYIISSIDGRDWSPHLISQLSYDDLYEKLDGDMMFHHLDRRSEKTESFSVVQVEAEKEFYVARLVAQVRVSHADLLSKSIAGEQNWYRSPEVGFDIRCVYNAKRRPELSIEGPAYHPDCFIPW